MKFLRKIAAPVAALAICASALAAPVAVAAEQDAPHPAVGNHVVDDDHARRQAFGVPHAQVRGRTGVREHTGGWHQVAATAVAGIGPVRSKVAPIMLAPENVDAPWVDEWLAMVDRTDRAGLVKAIESVADRDPCEDEAVRIIAPTLIMVGESDAATPEVKSRRLEELIATTRFHTISGAGHSSTMENPDEVNTILSAFLSEYNA